MLGREDCKGAGYWKERVLGIEWENCMLGKEWLGINR